MDFSWTPYFGTFWMFPLFCLLFMAFMVFGCGGMWIRRRHGIQTSSGRESAREILDRRYAAGEIAKEQYDAMRREVGERTPGQR